MKNQISLRNLCAGLAYGGLTGNEAEFVRTVENPMQKKLPYSGIPLPAKTKMLYPDATVANLVNTILLVDRIKANSLVMKLGATFMPDLIENLDIAAEEVPAWIKWMLGQPDPEDAPEWSKATLEPLQVLAQVEVSDTLLRSKSPEADLYFVDLLMRGLAEALDSAAIAGDGTTAPLGILNMPDMTNTISLTPNGLAPTWLNVLDLEEKAADTCLYEVLPEEIRLSERYAYLTNRKVKRKLKVTPKITDSDQMVWGEDPMLLNGHMAAVSPHVPATGTLGNGTGLSSMIFGDWSKLLIAQWGPLDLLVDRYQKGRTGKVIISLRGFYNFHLLRKNRFSILKGIVTT